MGKRLDFDSSRARMKKIPVSFRCILDDDTLSVVTEKTKLNLCNPIEFNGRTEDGVGFFGDVDFPDGVSMLFSPYEVCCDEAAKIEAHRRAVKGKILLIVPIMIVGMGSADGNVQIDDFAERRIAEMAGRFSFAEETGGGIVSLNAEFVAKVRELLGNDNVLKDGLLSVVGNPTEEWYSFIDQAVISMEPLSKDDLSRLYGPHLFPGQDVRVARLNFPVGHGKFYSNLATWQ